VNEKNLSIILKEKYDRSMIKTHIEAKLCQVFSPTYLEVKDESHLHAGHKTDRPKGSYHFSVRIVSPVFCGLTRIERHKRVYECLKDDLKEEVHALRLKTLCPEEGALHGIG